VQILYLIDETTDIQYLKSILNYDKSFSQNILVVQSNFLYRKDKFIYAKECIVLNQEKKLKNILLSPSIVIDITKLSNYSDLESYINSCWLNTQQLFYSNNKLKEVENKINTSSCIAYVQSIKTPFVNVIENSITLDSKYKELTSFNTIGVIEQAITEYFADINFFSQFNSEVLDHQSMIFSIKFDIIKRYGDFVVDNISFIPLSYKQLLNYDEAFLFEYLDNLLKYRLDRYIEQVKFRTHIIKLCDEYKIDLEPSYYKTFILTKNNHIGLQRTYYGALNSEKGISIINNKHKTNQFLQENGFKTNLSYEYVLDDLLDKKVIEEIPINYPITMKPTDKKAGYGVVTNIPNEKRMLVSVKKMKKLEDIKPIILEEFFEGITYRVLVVSGEVCAVLKYIPASILGDGESSIEELIKAKNLVSKSRVRINNALRLSIFNDGNTWETILAKGQEYIISHNSHASNGGQSINVTDIFDEKYKRISSNVCKSLDLKLAGIDMIVNSKGDYRIIEVNCGPALAIHLNPKHGESIDTYTKVLYSLLEEVDLEHDDNSYLKKLVPYHK